MTVSLHARPKLAAKARLRFDRKSDRYMLLYPEKGLVLNPTGSDIVHLCTGEHTVGAIIEQLVAKYGTQPRDLVEREVVTFLDHLFQRALLADADAGDGAEAKAGAPAGEDDEGGT